jgi:hypothetical protein
MVLNFGITVTSSGSQIIRHDHEMNPTNVCGAEKSAIRVQNALQDQRQTSVAGYQSTATCTTLYSIKQ